MKIRILKPWPGRNEGDVVDVEADEHGVPLEQFWRRRLRDAKLDGCVEVVQSKPKSGRAKAAEGSEQ